MLKPMKPKTTIPRNAILWALVGLLVLSGIIALVSAFSGSGANPEEDVNAVYTNAAATLAVQQMTLQASTPTITPTIVTETPTVALTPLASPTLFTQPVLATSTRGAASGAVGCNNSAYVADVTIPDDTVVTPGQALTKTWKLSNTGSCAWTATYKVSFVSGNQMGGTATPIGVAVQPGQSADISIKLTAPATAGDAIGYWILTNDTGQNFGTSFYIKVKVGGAATTGTVTATATSTNPAPAPVAPNAASNVAITLTCTLGGTNGTQKEHAGTLTWTDNSTNETGFNIYINSVFAATVAPNTISFGVPAGNFYDPGVSSTYAVEAINGSLKAAQATVTVNCP